MAKKFKCKKRRKLKIRYFIYLIVLFLIYCVALHYLSNITLAHSNEEFLKYLLEDPTYYEKYENKGYRLLEKVSNKITNINMDQPITLLESTFNVKKQQEKKESKPTIKLVYHQNNIEPEKIPTVTNSPRVYIYNTHQKETYSSTYLEDYNITPNVKMVSYLLKEKLENLGIPTLVEEADINEFMSIHNWTHPYSYQASRYYLDETLSKYPDLDLIIDLHRDALKKSSSTTTIDNKNYAKVLLVVGKEHKNYQTNLELANQINDKIKAKYPTLTRGILPKEGTGVNGIYNQDASPNMILLECGGNENTIGEVSNTIELLAPIIKEFIDEKRR